MMADRSPAETQKFLKTARERFEQGQSASHKQRQRVLADLAFYAGGERQWDPETLRNRQAQQGVAGMPPVPARPCLTIDKLREPVHQVLNLERQSEMGVQLVPADDWGELAPPVSEEEIELREGLVRRIQRESEASDARTWAFTRAAIAGEGYYRVMTRWAQGKTWDKEVYVQRIFNQASVTLDPAHEQPDGSDCEWEFLGGDLPWDRYKREYPRTAAGDRNVTAGADEATFRALGEDYPGWFTSDGETRSARVVEYFYTEWQNRTLVKLVNGSALWEDELPEDFPEDQIEDTREVPQKTIKWAKIDATHILEETDWEGPDMPIIKVVGEELQPFDNERRVEGMVRPARDAQQGFNAMISKWVEYVGLSPLPSWQLAEENISPYGNWYSLANTRTLPFLPHVSRDADGRELPVPTRTNVSTDVAAIAASVQMFDEAIKSTTMVPSVQLGQATDRHIKAKGAIDALIAQGQQSTSHLLDNLRRSLRYEGQVENNLLFPIYGRPGRLARMLTGENEPQTVRIGGGNGTQPAVAGANGIQPGAVPSAGGQGLPPGGPAPGIGAPPSAQKPPKTYTLTEHANFNVIVKVSRSSESRRESEASFVGTMLQANPELMGWFGDLFFRNQDGPGHDEMADRAEVMLDPKIQQLRQSKQQGTPVPPEVQAQLAQLTQQLDAAHQLLQTAHQEIQGKEADQAAKVHIVELEIASKERLAAAERESKAMDREVKLAIAELGAKVEHLELFLEERARIGKQEHEVALTAAKAAHELKKLRITKTLMRGPNGELTGATEDHEEVPM